MTSLEGNERRALQSILSRLVTVEDVGDVVDCVDDESFSLNLLHWRMLSLMKKQTDEILSNEILFQDMVAIDLLELLLCSGYVQDHRWISAINILTSLFTLDSYSIQTNPYCKRLSVAVALSFSTDVKSLASYGEEKLDPIRRYFDIKEMMERDDFFPIHKTLNTWLLRYVVSSWSEPSDIQWARQNIRPEFRTPHNVGESTHEMLKYSEHNSQGVSIHDGPAFYDNKPCTLEVLHEYGAVCGGVSKFGVAMAQAFGIPACPIGQPGHCAFLWLKDGEWKMSNGCSGIIDSHTHEGIQWTWEKRCDYQLLCHEAMKSTNKYVESEKLRWIAKLIQDRKLQLETLNLATVSCPYNYLAWRDLIRLLGYVKREKVEYEGEVAGVDQWVLWNLEEMSLEDQSQESGDKILSQGHYNVSLTSNVMENIENLVDGTDSEWYCRDSKGWVEIDLGRLCNISAIEIQWWGISVSRKYKIYASPDKSNSESTLVATHHSAIESPPPDEYNEWSKLPGWDREMRKIKFVFKKGHKDPWGMNVLIGIRQIQILGQEKEDPTSLTTNLLERYLLKRVQKTFSKEFSQIAKDFFIDIKKSGSSLISIDASITTSSGQDLAYNLLDGTDSEWWTKKKEATIELDLGRSYHVALFEIKWWGISFAASFTVSVAMGDEDNYVEVMTRGNCYEHPAGRDSYNEWSKSNGWEQITRKIKIHLKDGCIDPWFKKYYLGARCIQITGFPA